MSKSRKRPRRKPPGTTSPLALLERAAGRLSWAALLLALVVFAHLLWGTSQIPSLGTDSLIYHLTIPAYWLQRGLLSQVELPFHDSAAEHSPMLTQMISYLLMRLTGDEGLCWLIQPVFLLVTFRLFYLSARLLGLRRRPALLGTCLFILFPPFLQSAQMVNNELALVCGCALLLYGLLRSRRRRGVPVLLAAAGIGLMLATKVVGLIYAAVGILLLVPAAWVRFRRAAVGQRRRLALEAVAAAAVLLAGSAFYLRNWALHGNPLYPAEVRVWGATLFAGLYDASKLIDHGWSLSALGKMLLHDGSGTWFALKLPFSGLLWVGFLTSLILVLARFRRRASWRVLAVTAAFPLLSVLLYFAVTPFWRQHRLLFPVYYALWLSAASGLTRVESLGRRRLGLAVGLLLAGAFVVQLHLMGFWGEGRSWLLAAAVGLVACIRWPRRLLRRLCLPAAAAALVLATTSAAWYPRFRAARQADRGRLYAAYYGPQGGAWDLAGRLSRPGEPVTVAYAGSPLIFPLFGPRLDNRVVYVPVSSEDRPRPVALKRGDSIYQRLAQARRVRRDERFWLDRLRRERVQLVCLVDDAGRGGAGPELAMIRRHPEMFQPLFQAQGVYLYRVRRE